MTKRTQWYVTLLTAFFWQCTNLSATQASERPNILFIAIDDLNDWVGCLAGHPQAITPNMDALARRGVLFTNAHCQGPICGPSRASLLSGRYPHSTGIYQQPTGSTMEKDREHFNGQLLPQYFASHGYLTLGCGKITHGFSPKKAFDLFGGTFGGSGPKPKERFHYHLPDVPWTGTQTDWGAFPDVDEKMPDHRTADWAIDQLGQDHTKPFFLAVGFVRPHVPFYVPAKWFEDFPLAEIELPEVDTKDLDDVPEISRQIHEMPKYPTLSYLQANDNTQFRLAVQAYLACTKFVDHQVGRVLQGLTRSDYRDNTVIVLFSDHGYHLGEKNRISKHSLWEEATRVPLIVSTPGQTDSKTCARPVGLIDLYPTLLELSGLPPRPQNEGRSLVTLLQDPNAAWRDAVLTTYAKDNHSLRGERFRYIHYQDGSQELYDRAADPNEWTNLADRPEHAETIAKFRELLPTTSAPYHKATSAKTRQSVVSRSPSRKRSHRFKMTDPSAGLDSCDPATSNQTGLPQRLLSLDTYRGLIMCTLAANGLALAATANKLGYGVDAEVTSGVGQIWQWLAFHNSHPFWNSQFYVFGCSYWDLIQPSFMFMVGVAMPYSYASRRKRGDSTAKLTTHALIRALVLIALGVFLQTRNTGLESNRLFTNVLAQIGLGYFFVFLLLGRGVRLQISVAAIVLAGYWVWFVQFQVPDPLPKPAAESIETLPTRPRFAKHFGLNTNPASEFDVMLFNALPHQKPIKAHAAGYATLNFIPSAVTMLLGVLAGTLLRSRRDEYEKLRFLLLGGLFCMLAAVAISYTYCPIVKKIWTPSWTMYSGAWVLWILAALYWIVDIRGWKAWTFPLVIVGMNSLAIYLMSMLLKRWVSDCLEAYLGDQIFAGLYGPTIQAASVFIVFWLTCLYLYHSKIFFRV